MPERSGPEVVCYFGLMMWRNISEVKPERADLLKAVETGEEVIPTKAGQPIARLTNCEGLATPRKLGALQG